MKSCFFLKATETHSVFFCCEYLYLVWWQERDVVLIFFHIYFGSSWDELQVGFCCCCCLVLEETELHENVKGFTLILCTFVYVKDESFRLEWEMLYKLKQVYYLEHFNCKERYTLLIIVNSQLIRVIGIINHQHQLVLKNANAKYKK